MSVYVNTARWFVMDLACARRDALNFTRLQLVLYLVSARIDKIVELQYRLFFVLSASLCLIYLPLIANALGRCLVSRRPWIVLCLFYFILHPWIIFFAASAGAWQMPVGLTPLLGLISSMSYVLNALILTVACIFFTSREFDDFLHLLWKFALIIAMECVLSFYLLRGTPIYEWAVISLPEGSRYQSLFVASNYISGLLGLILCALSLYFQHVRNDSKIYFFSFFMGILLTVSCLERSVFLGLFVLFTCILTIILLKGFRWLSPPSNFFRMFFLVVGCLAILGSAVFAMVALRKASLTSFESGMFRVFMWVRAAETSLFFFPLGCGGNLTGRYNTSAIVPHRLTEMVTNDLTTDPNMQNAIQVAQRYISDVNERVRISNHSTHMEFIAEFGIFGIGLALFAIFYPVRVILGTLHYMWCGRRDCAIEKTCLLASLLLGLQLPLFMISAGNNLSWIVGVIYAYMHFSWQSLRSTVPAVAISRFRGEI